MNLLFKHFGKERVTQELDAYFELPMHARFGAGIGVGRLARAMQLSGLLKEPKELIQHHLKMRTASAAALKKKIAEEEFA
jgi:hypothetical protein